MSATPAYRYTIFGVCVESDHPLPELLPNTIDTPRLRVQALPPQESIEEAPHEIRRWDTRDGQTVRIAAKHRGGYLLRFPGNADFLISADCAEIRYRCEHGLAGLGFRHALLDQVIPRTLAQGGHLVLHSSAVCVAAGAICLIGGSGRGKSTLATAFQSRDAHLLADDSVLLDLDPGGITCVPAYPGVRLWPDSAATLAHAIQSQVPLGYVPEKLRCYLDTAGSAPPDRAPLCAILSLRRWGPQEPLTRIKLSRLPSAVAATELMAHSFIFDLSDRGHLSQALAQTARVVAAVPVYLARYPSDLAYLPQVCAEITRVVSLPPGPLEGG